MLKSLLNYSGETLFWLFLGLAAQVCFFLRFFIQWIASERRGESFIPVSFWYLSLFGSLGLFIYAVHRRDPVFIIGQLTGFFIYTRNLALIKKNTGKINAA